MLFFSVKDLMAISPEIIVAGAASVLLLVDFLFPKKKEAMAYFSILAVGLAGAASLCLLSTPVAGGLYFMGSFAFDGFSVFFKNILCLTAVLSIMLSLNYLKEEGINSGEYYILMLFSLSGMMVMASGADLLTIYVGIELMSIPVYVLVGFAQNDKKSSEGAMKYIILGAFSSGILLYGISLIYGITGTTELSFVSKALAHGAVTNPLFAIAAVLLAVGFGFKIAGVPFHMWAPDAYEGAPTPVTAFLSVGSKAAAFAALLRVFMTGLYPAYEKWQVILAVVAVASIFYGSLTAMAQDNIKRMLAYSSIAHAGYALLGVVAGSAAGVAGVMYYMFVYLFMNMGIFAIVIMMRKGSQRGELIKDYTGFAKTNAPLAFVALILLFSLAGIPPTAGFMGKFYVFMALIDRGMIALAVVALMGSAMAAYFYIRIVMLMYMKEPEAEMTPARSRAVYYTLAVTAAATVFFGVYPSYVIDIVRKVALDII